ncbi:hypothetical protein AWC38_SpisGene24539 [Stylophora pistillata]|uniref:Helix-turn-helix domain-containing protein n=1 Tax=Stylophora pistillata TaxID=50429 RepID=A0A2B4R5K6_STYPI|nr:hypothetical protein AWC38_SpisGene24539 [Stylophora pistillata]
MELASGNKLPFVGMEVLKKGCKLETSVYRKPTNTGLLLHHQSHVDKRYKKSLLKTMLNRAFRLSSTWESFKSECDHLKMMFTNLKYPDHLINSTISHFVTSVRSENPGVQAQLSVNENAVHRVVLPFKDQKSADAVKRQLSDLSNKIDHTLHPVFKSRKICEDLRDDDTNTEGEDRENIRVDDTAYRDGIQEQYGSLLQQLCICWFPTYMDKSEK